MIILSLTTRASQRRVAVVAQGSQLGQEATDDFVVL
jgi:hypothetical protein